MTLLNDSYTSTGAKFFAHQQAMENLRNGKGQPITCHIMATDVCNHSCAFCSVHHREGNVLPLSDILAFIDTLLKFGLKSCILSGGGNPILYKCPQSGAGFNVLVAEIHARGLEIGLITNGMRLSTYYTSATQGGELGLEYVQHQRRSWSLVTPATLDKLTWVRISMSGLDHSENEVFVPDVDPSKTALGFSYVFHDIYDEPADKAHGKVSTIRDLITVGVNRLRERVKPTRWATWRIPQLRKQLREYVEKWKPRYVRLLPNCLEPDLIEERCRLLSDLANEVNSGITGAPVFVQYKPPAPPRACYLGYIHPVLNSDGYVLPCDSCCLNESAGHKLGEAWRICHWSEIATLYEQPVRSLIKDTKALCPGCVFTKSNELLATVVDGTADLIPPSQTPEHVNFV